MAMRRSNINMTTTVKKADLIKKVEENLAKHKKIVAEAKAGYLKKAAAAVEKKLADLKAGKVVSLDFNLRRPADYTEVYTNSLEMLRWNTAEEVELEADEFRQLVRDQWDWTSDFLHTNASYSAIVGSMSGGGAEEEPVDAAFGGSGA